MSISGSQSWKLSQAAKKGNGVCSVCKATRQIHLGNGLIHKHGPRKNVCPGSDKPPLGPSGLPSMAPVSAGSDGLAGGSLSQDRSPIIGASDSSLVHSSLPVDSVWAPPDKGVIKYIPKSARVACACHLARIMRTITSHPQTCSNWFSLFQWAGSTLGAVEKSGKRSNVASMLMKRITTFNPADIGNAQSLDTHPSRSLPKKATPSLAKSVAAKLKKAI